MQKNKLIIVVILAMFAALGILGVSLAGYIQATNRHLEFSRNVSEILYIDQIFTMDAHMGAATNDPQWEDDYNAQFAAMDAAIKSVFDTSTEDVRSALDVVVVASEGILALERQAFEFARAGDRENALRAVNSEEYRDLKEVYMTGLRRAAKQAEQGLVMTQQTLLRVLIMTMIANALLSVFAITQVVLSFRRYRITTEQTLAEVEDKSLKLENALDAERQQAEMQAQFVSMASHEFRTPLAIIDGAARRIERKFQTFTEEQVKERTEQIRSAVTRMTMLVERTLDASKLTAGQIKVEPAPFNMRATLISIVKRYASMAPKHEITLDADALPTELYGDAKLLDNVFSNVISNAIKYSKDNPRVDILTEIKDGFAFVHVKDHGIGIPEGELAKVSERFFRASTAEGISGTGIGLNLVKELVRLHYGTLSIDSVEGEWSCFSIALPLESPLETADDESLDLEFEELAKAS